jgi:hypothetical protein
LLDPRGPRYTAVLGEAALHRPLGGPAVMAEQLQHLAALVRRRRITLHVLPLTATPHPAATDGALRVMTYDGENPILHVATHHTGIHQTDPAAVALARLTHDLLITAALPPEPSLALIETTAAACAGQRDRPARAVPGQPISSSVLPLVSRTKSSTKGMESTAKQQ